MEKNIKTSIPRNTNLYVQIALIFAAPVSVYGYAAAQFSTMVWNFVKFRLPLVLQEMGTRRTECKYFFKFNNIEGSKLTNEVDF